METFPLIAFVDIRDKLKRQEVFLFDCLVGGLESKSWGNSSVRVAHSGVGVRLWGAMNRYP